MFFISGERILRDRWLRREGKVATGLAVTMVEHVTEMLKDDRIKKVSMIDVAVANAKSTRLPTGLQRPVVDRLVGKAQSAACSALANRAAEHARARDTRSTCMFVSHIKKI